MAVLQAAAIVAIAEVVIADFHFHLAVAQSRTEQPGAALPFRLDIRIEAGNDILLIAAQPAFQAKGIADVILITRAVIAGAAVIDADGCAQLSASQLVYMQPIGVDAIKIAFEIDHAARLTWGILDDLGKCLVLDHIAVAPVSRHVQAIVAEALFIGGADLLVVYAFACVVAIGQGALRVLCIRRVDFAGARIAGKRGPGDAQRILRIALMQGVGDDGQRAVCIWLDGNLAESLFARGGTMVAVAIRTKARAIEHIADAACLALRADIYFTGAVAAARQIQFDGRRILAILGKQLDHAAGMVAVDSRKRSAQYFDALGGIEVEGGGLALAIGHGGGYAVADQAHAAHAKGGTGAKAARGNLQILRIVLAVLHHQPGHGGQRFRGVDADLTILDTGAVDHVDRSGHFPARVFDTAATDDHDVQYLGVRGIGGEGRACKKQAGDGVQAEALLHIEKLQWNTRR